MRKTAFKRVGKVAQKRSAAKYNSLLADLFFCRFLRTYTLLDIYVLIDTSQFNKKNIYIFTS